MSIAALIDRSVRAGLQTAGSQTGGSQNGGAQAAVPPTTLVAAGTLSTRNLLAKLERPTVMKVATLQQIARAGEVDEAVTLIESASTKLTAMIRTIRVLEETVQDLQQANQELTRTQQDFLQSQHDLQQEAQDLQAAKDAAEDLAREAQATAAASTGRIAALEAASRQHELDYEKLKSNIDRLLSIFAIDASELALLE